MAIAREKEMEYNEKLDELKLLEMELAEEDSGRIDAERRPIKEIQAFRREQDKNHKTGPGSGAGRYSILLVSDRTGKVHTLRTTFAGILLGIAFAVLLVGSLAACLIYSGYAREGYEESIASLNKEISTLTEDKILLEADLEARDRELSDLTKKLSEKESRAKAKTEEEKLLFVPSALPLDSQTLPSEYDKKNKWITIDAAPGSHVVAAGSGSVEYAGESVESGGYLVTVDHGNGYKSDYYCQGRPVVKEGKKVDRGAALFAVGNEGDKLFYRIRYEDDYIDPYTVLNIAG